MSSAHFEEAQTYIPGGVNSPVRSMRILDMEPIFIESGSGSKFYDTAGKEYIDYMGSWGPLILGHAHPQVVSALQEAAKDGTSFGAPTQKETELARMVAEAVPSIEMLRMVNSGTEAVMSALRVARGYTGRDKIIKFTGCYHGHSDSLLIQAGSGVATLGLPNSPGVTEGTARDTITAPFNNLEAVEDIFAEMGKEIAAVILEPVPGNVGVIPPLPGYLEGLRRVTQEHGSLLIFDEVMTGFRLAYGGAQELYGVTPDITCLGKVVGGGMPVGVFGGSQEIMQQVAPLGPVYQAGTLAGNPLAMVAGIETLKELQKPGTYQGLEKASAVLEEGLADAATEAGGEARITRVGSMFSVYFTQEDIVDLQTVHSSDKEKYKQFYRSLLEDGVYLSPSPFEASFVSLAHSEDDIEATIKAARKAFSRASGV